VPQRGNSDALSEAPGSVAAVSVTEQPLVLGRGLTKRFGDFTAVDAIDVEVRRGEAFGFLGPNGAAAFLLVMLVMGLVRSWWALLALPATVLIGFAFAAVGMAATSFMRSWQDFDFVQLAILPMFLFSTTFYPLGIYPRPLQLFVECTPLYHGIELLRALSTGAGVGLGLVGHAAYFVVLAALGISVSARRLERLLLK